MPNRVTSRAGGPLRLFAPVAMLLATPSLSAQAPAAPTTSFTGELALSFSFVDTRNERPLVVLDGVRQTRYLYHGDGEAWGLDVAATRYFAEIPDDGVSPIALLGYLTPVSSVTAAFGLAGASADSSGRATPEGPSISTTYSTYSGDSSARGGALSGEWYVSDAQSIRGSAGYRKGRGTAATRVERIPGGLDLGSIGTREERWDFSLGALRWLGPVTTVGVDVLYGTREIERSDEIVFGPPPGSFSRREEAEGDLWGLQVAARTLLFSRRLAVDAFARYADGDADLEQDSFPRSVGRQRTVARSVSGVVTWYPTRFLGLGGGLSYGTDTTTFGREAERRISAAKAVTAGATARWFPMWRSGRTSIEASYTRTVTSRVSPPDERSFERTEDTDDRVALTATLRF